MKIAILAKKAISSFYSSIKRFPETLCMSAATAVMLIIISELQPDLPKFSMDILIKLAMIFALGIPVSLCIKLALERYKVENLFKTIIFWLAGIIFLVFYYFILLPDFKMIPITRYIAVSAVLYLIFLFLPYFFRREHFVLYVIKLFLRFLVAALYSGVLFAGMAAILFTIDKLLLIHVYDKLYYYVWLVIAGVFAPSFFLAGIPLYNQQMEKDDFSKLLRILLLYIVMPLITAYTTILYIYFAKIIITFQWPNGLVANLVLWYSVISTVVIFLTSPLVDSYKWVRMFIFWYIKLVLPLLIMMFISLVIRINAYGVTENRYFVVLLGLWVTGIMIYLNLSKIKRSIIMLVSLAAITLLSVFGPWSTYSVSIYSQNMRFESLLGKYNMLVNGLLVKPTRDVSDNDKKEFSAILLYFSNTHDLKDVKYLPKDFKLENMENTFGFPYDTSRGIVNNEGYISYTLKMLDTPVDIKGYDYILYFQNYQQPRSIKGDGWEIKYNNSDTSIKVLVKGKPVYEKKLTDFVKKLYDAHKSDVNNVLPLDEMTFTDGNDSVTLKYIVNNVYGIEDKGTSVITVNGIDFYVIFKVK